jgi:hypothetical protein
MSTKTITVEAATKLRKRKEFGHHIGKPYWGALADGVWYNVFTENRPERGDELRLYVVIDEYRDKKGDLKLTYWADVAEEKMKVGEAYPGKWIKAADLHGKRVPVVIDSVAMENIGDDGDKMVVYFKGKDKGLVCNVTNAHMIEEIANSDETDDWNGVQVVLYSTKVDFSGRRVDAIRVDYPPKSPQDQRQPSGRTNPRPAAPRAPVAGQTPMDEPQMCIHGNVGPDCSICADDIPF